MSLLETLPEEVLIQCLAELEYPDLARVSGTSRHLHGLAEDVSVWQAVCRRTLDESHPDTTKAVNGTVEARSRNGRRRAAARSGGRSDGHASYAQDDEESTENEHKRLVRERVIALREFLQVGSTDLRARVVRQHFAEMGARNARLIDAILSRSPLDVDDICVDLHGHAFSERRLPHVLREMSRCAAAYPSSDGDSTAAPTAHDSAQTSLDLFLASHAGRLQVDPRSEIYLLRILLSRHCRRVARTRHYHAFLKAAHLVVYNSVEYPILYYPPVDLSERLTRRILRSQTPTSAFPRVNWGVVESIHAMFNCYRHRQPDDIPGFRPARDWFEDDVPLQPCMFDAGLEGNWSGLYGYLDFRELDVLDESRDLTPDYFDGIQSIRFRRERPCARLEGEPQRWHFSGDGRSVHGPFHLHGTTIALDGFEPGFKVVRFDEMLNVDGVMPWVMEGVYIPSIGIVGRWRDNDVPRGEGVEGGYVLWRNRAQDYVSYKRRLEWEARREHDPALDLYDDVFDDDHVHGHGDEGGDDAGSGNGSGSGSSEEEGDPMQVSRGGFATVPKLEIRTAPNKTDLRYVCIEEATSNGRPFLWSPDELQGLPHR